MTQSRRQSMTEAAANIVVGMLLNTVLNYTIFPLLGWKITAGQNAVLVVIYTGASLLRSYGLRRLFNRWHRPAPLQSRISQ